MIRIKKIGHLAYKISGNEQTMEVYYDGPCVLHNTFSDNYFDCQKNNIRQAFDQAIAEAFETLSENDVLEIEQLFTCMEIGLELTL